MTVLDRSELQASPLADLHLIADQMGLEGFRRLRKEELIEAILADQGHADRDGQASSEQADEPEQTASRTARTRRSRLRPRRERAREAEPTPSEERRAFGERGLLAEGEAAGAKGEATGEGEAAGAKGEAAGEGETMRAEGETTRAKGETMGAEGEAAGAKGEAAGRGSGEAQRGADGVVEVLGNGSGFLRVHPPEPSEQDVYISAAQVRRCELVSGDRVSGPVRRPRRSERYPSLVRVETVNGQPADSGRTGTRYEDMPAAWPTERIAFDSEDPTLKAIEWLTPLGLGSRAAIVGGPRSGKTEALRRIGAALASRGQFELSLVLAGCRPEEIEEWRQGPVGPVAALHFAASADAQSQAVEGVIEAAKRLAARGGNAFVLIDGLDGVHPHAARKALAAARNLGAEGSLTVIATGSRPFGGETTVIALDAIRAGSGRFPALDLLSSGTLRAELLIGPDGAEAIAQARAAAAEA